MPSSPVPPNPFPSDVVDEVVAPPPESEPEQGDPIPYDGDDGEEEEDQETQDNERERETIRLFGDLLYQRPGRTRQDPDAFAQVSDQEVRIEVKSATTRKGSVTTVRDFGPHYATKWEGTHWVIAIYKSKKLSYSYYASPASIGPWIAEKLAYVQPDFDLAVGRLPQLVTLDDLFAVCGKKESYTFEDARKLHKKQWRIERYREHMDYPLDGPKTGYTPAAMLEILQRRAAYLGYRGSTLNNPHIPKKVVDTFTRIDIAKQAGEDDAALITRLSAHLRELIAAALASAGQPSSSASATDAATA